jgi:hypothetical protein
LTRYFGLATAAAIFAFCTAGAIAQAQEAQTTPVAAPATPVVAQTTPEPLASPTLLDRQYDGNLHVTFAPYLWAPTIKSNFQFSVPRLPNGNGGHVIAGNIAVGPSDYLSKLNSGAMGAFDIRKGNFDLYADAIYFNATTNATIVGNITGPGGHVKVPVTFNSSARLASGIYEIALGSTVARSHYANLDAFLGYRDFPVNLSIGYNATVGKRGLIAPYGTVTTSDHTEDAVFGIKGRIFFGNGRLFVPYYGDFGGGNNNSTWQAYGGLGYAYPHGQSFLLLYRQIDYYGFPDTAHVQRLDLGGPTLGYTFNL